MVVLASWSVVVSCAAGIAILAMNGLLQNHTTFQFNPCTPLSGLKGSLDGHPECATALRTIMCFTGSYNTRYKLVQYQHDCRCCHYIFFVKIQIES